MSNNDREATRSLALVVKDLQRFWQGVAPTRMPGPGVDEPFEEAVRVYGGQERAARGQFVYFTQGAQAYVNPGSDPLEFILIAAQEMPAVATMLQSVAFAQWTLERGAQLGRISDLGEPWAPGSDFSHLYFSPPYLLPHDSWHVPGTESAHWCWVIPVSEREAAYGLKLGSEALEVALEEAAAPIGALLRASVV